MKPVRIVSLDQSGRDFMRESLVHGLGLARGLSDETSRLHNVYAIVSEDANVLNICEFRFAVGGFALPGFRNLIASRYAGRVLVLELPMRRPWDSPSGVDQFVPVVKSDDIFATCVIGESDNVLDDVLRSQDTTFLYCGFVFRDVPAVRAWVRSSDSISYSALASALEAVFVGAYDGEGILMLTKDALK
ncbi:hypothetical protein [Nocardia camponoti]|uniref:Uncharacterized protein n=1 Tax=Nocardia camponoti TaxID=1616106 RepID=A0A917QNA5_9NOCA|nr:hypothetical protein [Nocardia camponoti]GGK59983.1 hypothetical protein GCM10011591_35380 [Nocardia camponoti]